jgi:hypothetical protein
MCCTIGSSQVRLIGTPFVRFRGLLGEADISCYIWSSGAAHPVPDVSMPAYLWTQRSVPDGTGRRGYCGTGEGKNA